MKKLLAIILSITMLISMGTVAFADGVDGPMQKAKLTVGINAEFPPFEYYEGEELKGFDIDLMNYIGERIGFDIEFVNMSFDKLIPAVVNGEVNCAISAITVTEEREKVVDFTTPYLSTGEHENYAIVFPEGLKDSSSVYQEVDKAIKELIADSTVEKLLVIHEVEKHFVVDDEDIEVNYINETKDDAAYVMDILKLSHENIANIHIGRVNANQYTEVVKIENPDDVKAFYNKFIALPFVEKADNYDGITIQFKSKKNGVLTSYYTTYGVFGGTFGTHYDEGIVEDMYVSEQEIYKIIEELDYKWEVYYGDAYTDTSVAETVPAPSEWAAKDIDYAVAVGITEANKDYLYKENITREEFCELIYNLIVLASDEITAPITDSFTDTKNDKILMLNGLGIINGKSATEFAPNDYLTREEAATIIVRMVNKVFPMAATEMWFEYDDIDEVSEWASDSIQTISNLGFMKGIGNNNFAPKATYTTEQAIVTLVRVLDSAGASGLLDENTSIGIIGGADGPTSIIIGENTTVIGGADNPTEIVVTDTIKVDDFYVDEAIKLITESGKLASDKDFISVYTTNDEMTEKVLALGAVDFNKPTDIYYLSADREKIIANIETLAKAEGVDIKDLGDNWFEHIWRKLNFSTLAGMINASYGAENLAALTILTNSRGYIMPKDFKNNFALFVQYEGDYSAIVSFSEFGDGVISANMSFVKNGDKDNVFMRMYEITSAVGEDGVKIAKVEQ